ncbi:3'(2'), 5'-bisphosphate nucleotidase / inositol polyphosphate 1-phosphatase [Nematocida sp. AWRm77]|nr:3'(2'), 5'-bisphosphate nucleotidase / inositol polyphosphate 1-phosphatase [Nematocida sp. AWRm77]
MGQERDSNVLRLFQACLAGMHYGAKLAQTGRMSSSFIKEDATIVTFYDIAIQVIFSAFLEPFDIDFVSEEDEHSLLYQETLQAMKSKTKEELLPKHMQDICQFIKTEGISVERTCRALKALQSPDRLTVILDPIDGTKGFVGGREFSIVLSAVRKGSPVFSVIASPSTHAVYYCINQLLEEHAPSLLLDRPKPQVFPIKDTHEATVQAFTSTLAVRVGISFETQHSDPRMDTFLSLLKKKYAVQVERIDGQSKYAYLAAGRLDLFVRLPAAQIQEKVWDHCAGIDMASACVITDIRGNVLSPCTPTQYGVIASSSPTLHQESLKIISSLFGSSVPSEAEMA